MKIKLLRFWPVLSILSVWFIFASPYFIKGLVPYPAKYQVTFFHPWSAYEQWWGPVKNNAMPDVITQIYPWKHFTIEWLKKGQIPFWNPYSFSGNPHVGNFQSAVFSPFNLLYFVLPFIDAWSVLVLVQPLLAGLFTYLLLREFKISKAGALISSITFMFSGFNVVWMAYGTLTMAIAFLPLALFAIEKAYNTKNKIYFLLFTVSIILSFFSGHVQTTFYFIVLTVFYLVYKFIFAKNLRYFLSSIIFLLLGLLVSLIQIYPSSNLYLQSVRSESLYQGGGIPWIYLVTMFAPDFYGNPVTRNDWYGTYAEWSSFVGITPLLFAILAVIFIKNRQIYFFSAAGIVSLLFALDTPLHKVLVASKIPILATSIPSRLVVLFSLCLAVLAGFGFDKTINSLVIQPIRKIIPVILAFMSMYLLIWLLTAFAHIFPPEKAKIALKNLILPSMLFLCTITILFFYRKFQKKRLIARVLLSLLLFLVGFDSVRFAAKWMPYDSRELVFPDLPVIKAMQQYIGNGRVYGNIGTEATTYYGLSSIEGYDPLYPKRYGEFLRFASMGTWQEAERSVAKLDRRGQYTKKALDLLSVNLIYHPLADTNTSWAFPVWEDSQNYSVIYQDEKFQIYRNNSALPRAYLYYDYEIIKDSKEILERLYSDNFNIKEKLILEKKPPFVTHEIDNLGIVKIEEYTPNKIVVTTQASSPALLYLTDSYYPKWHALVNGQDTEIFRANYTFRAVIIPEGYAKVEFVYREYF